MSGAGTGRPGVAEAPLHPSAPEVADSPPSSCGGPPDHRGARRPQGRWETKPPGGTVTGRASEFGKTQDSEGGEPRPPALAKSPPYSFRARVEAWKALLCWDPGPGGVRRPDTVLGEAAGTHGHGKPGRSFALKLSVAFVKRCTIPYRYQKRNSVTRYYIPSRLSSRFRPVLLCRPPWVGTASLRVATPHAGSRAARRGRA